MDPSISLSARPIACRFSRRGCAHGDELFKPQYQRVNRSHGTKILRCFPHCCPRHIARSYCGSTIDLQVDVSPAVDASQLRVFARFRERDNEPALRVGDCLSLDAITRALQSSSQTKLPWIPSRIVSTADTLAFEINPSRRWYYPWVSGKNSARRATLHMLEAFVFVERQSEYGGDGSASLQCIATTQSPPFTLISFRRVDLHEEERESVKLPSVEPSISPHGGTRQFKQEETTTVIDVAKPEKLLVRPPPRSKPLRGSHYFSDLLGDVFAFVQQYPIDQVKPFIPLWTTLTEQGHAATIAPHDKTLDAEALAAHLIWWLTQNAIVQQGWLDHVHQGTHVLLDLESLERLFKQWMQWLEPHVVAFVATLSHMNVFRLRSLVANRLSQRSSRSCPRAHIFDWRSFVAQIRQTVVSQTTRLALHWAPTKAAWVCPLAQVGVAWANQVSPHASDDESFDHVSTLALFAFWQQLHHVQIDLDTSCSPHELRITSVRSVGSPMRLLLDNRFRWCNTLPSGESTHSEALPAAQFIGDYVAAYRRDASVELTFFSWGLETASKWTWRFRREDLASDRLDMEIIIGWGKVGQRYLAHGDDLMTRPIKDKLDSVASWQEQFHIHLPYRRVASAP